MSLLPRKQFVSLTFEKGVLVHQVRGTPQEKSVVPIKFSNQTLTIEDAHKALERQGYRRVSRFVKTNGPTTCTYWK